VAPPSALRLLVIGEDALARAGLRAVAEAAGLSVAAALPPDELDDTNETDTADVAAWEVGAAAGSLLYALVFSFSASYLPVNGEGCCTQYSIVSTFVLLALVLAFRPQGLFGRAG